MALVLKDRVKETTTTTGTGTVTLAGAVAGFSSFSVIGNANTTYYAIVAQTPGQWEVGIGTYTASGTTLARTTILASSNSNAAVNFSAGTKDVFVTYPADKSVSLDASCNVSPLGTVNSGIWHGAPVEVAYGGTNYTSYNNGELLIGNAVCAPGLTKATLTAGTNISITNDPGAITISVASAIPTVAGVVFGKTSSTFGRVALGLSAGNTFQGFNTVAVGVCAGNCDQGTKSVAVGAFAGQNNQQPCAVAIGACAGNINQGPNTVAVGVYAGFFTQSPNAIAVGFNAGKCTQSDQAVAIGTCAGRNFQGISSIAIGYCAGKDCQPNRSIVINATGVSLNATGCDQTHIGPIRNTCCTSGLQSLYYSPSTKEVIQGASPSVACATPTVAGKVFGGTTTCCFGGNTLLGHSSSAACIGGVAVGIYSYTNNFGTAVGRSANAGYAGVAVGINASTSSYSSVVVVGSCALATGGCSVAVGAGARAAGFGVAVGRYAVVTGVDGIAIGECAVAGFCSIALGARTVSTGSNQTHIGPIRNTCSTAGLQGLFYCAGTREVIQGASASVACATPTTAGIVFGRTDLGMGANTVLGYEVSLGCFACNNVVIGMGGGFFFPPTSAGSMSFNNVVIGARAQVGCNSGCSIAIGSAAVVCASQVGAIAIGYGTASTGSCQTHIGPLRNATTSNTLYYNPCTREITYG